MNIIKPFSRKSLQETICFCVIAFFSITNSFAQPGKDGPLTVAAAGTVVNAYDALAANITVGATSITATNIANLNTPAALAQGDLIMIIQMQGATINTTNTAAYGAVTTYNNAGNYEFAYVCSVAGNVINISAGTANAYTVTGKAQIIRVPQYTNLTVNVGASIIPSFWDGTKGGVVAIHASGTVAINGSIQANAAGFRGGKIDNLSSAAGIVAITNYFSNLNTEGAEKGEGIAGYQTDYDALGGRYGRGAPANGGGGGNGHNAGGGGGANGNNGIVWNGLGNPDLSGGAGWVSAWNLEGGTFSANTSSGGGRGGYTFGITNQDATVVGPSQNPWNGDYRHQLGGYGGRPLTTAVESKMFLGGGAGAGDGNDNANADGGDGGGIVYLIAANVAGTGTIQANGQNGFNTIGGGNDAPGGGGAGGSIIVKATVASALTINANGGTGGSQIIGGAESEGPGGGGGGGFVAINAGTPTITFNAGTNGTTSSTAVTEFTPNGATKGGIGENTSVTNSFVAYPTITATATPAAICLGSSSTLASSGASTYVWNPGALAGSSVSVSPAGNTTYTVTGTTTSGCVLTNTVAVSVTTPPSATVSYGAASFCTSAAAQAVTVTGTSGGTFSAAPAGLTINAATGQITPGTSSAGIYTVTYSIAASGGCSLYSTTASVTITTAPSSTISYTGSPYCTSAAAQSVNLTGTSGGTFSAAPAGLSINAATGQITPGTSSPGIYTITYSIAASGGCSLYSTTASVTITAAPSSIVSYTGSSFCTNAAVQTVNLTGTSGGTFSALPAGLSINAATGTITPATSSAGNYTVTYSVAASGGCSLYSTTAGITITSAPSATISYSASTFCTDASTQIVNVTGTAGGIFTASPAGLTINAATGEISPGTSSAGSYTVNYIVAAAGGCAVFNTTTAVVISCDHDNDNVSDIIDIDDDNDGILDVVEGLVDTDGDGIINSFDLDSDNDGITDVIESGGPDPDNNGIAGTGVVPPVDVNGLVTILVGVGVNNIDTDGDGIPNSQDIDSDNDGITDVTENGITDANNDGLADGTDTDGDGLLSSADQSAGFGDTGNTNTTPNSDGDSRPNYLDIDSDNDGITDVVENGMTDANNDGLADGTDVDSDGLRSSADQSVSFGDTGNTNAVINTDAAGSGNYIDIDSDNDGIVDNIEGQSTAGYIAPSGTDTDVDGLDDTYDASVGWGGAGLSAVNTDGTDTPDYTDLNSDNDTDLDAIEGWDTDNNGVTNTTPSGTDADVDGLDDTYDVNDAAWNPTNTQTPSSFPNLDNVNTSQRDWREMNNNPVAVTDYKTVNEDQCINIDVQANDTDIDNDPLTTTVINGPQHGTHTPLNSDSLNYCPNTNYNGKDTIIYQVCDGLGACDIDTVFITVNPVNDKPLAVNDTRSTLKNTCVDILVQSNDSDPDGDALTTAIVTDANHGTTTVLSGDTVRYCPSTNYTGNDTLYYSVCDGNGVCDTAQVIIDVNNVNHDPIAVTDYKTVNEDNCVHIDVQANDTDIDNDPLTTTVINGPKHGIHTPLNSDSLNYCPNTNYNGKDTIIYQVCDGLGACDIDTVFITVNPINDKPLAVNDTRSTLKNTCVDILVQSNDSDPDGDVLTTTIVTNVNHGTTSIVNSNYINYCPSNNYTGKDTLYYRVCDGNGGCDTAQVIITVNNVNQNPVAVTDHKTVNEDQCIHIDVQANDIDVDNDPLTSTVVNGPKHGIHTLLNSDSLNYCPNTNYNGKDTIIYRVCDGLGGCDMDTVFITVIPVNDNPVATTDTSSTKQNTCVKIKVQNNDDDIDGDNLITSIFTNPKNGTVTVLNNDSIQYCPTTDFQGKDTLIYQVCDGTACDTAFVIITVGFEDCDNDGIPDSQDNSKDCDFFIPEGFSPNNDGTNDRFVIRGILNYPNNTVRIFNRWGNLVYEKAGYKNEWDGTTMFGITVGGNELPEGVYFYIVDLGNNKVYKGDVYLKR